MVICKMILFRFHLNMMSPSNQLEAVLRYAFLHAFTPEQVCNIKKALQVYTQNSPFSLTFIKQVDRAYSRVHGSRKSTSRAQW